MPSKPFSGRSKSRKRFGVAELYGNDFANLPPDQIRNLASANFHEQICRFRRDKCNKKGGVCSLRLYEEKDGFAATTETPVVTTCPQRFKEGDMIFSWIGETLIGTASPVIFPSVPYLLKQDINRDNPEVVGQIDMVLASPDEKNLQWCAVEMQSVYFSGFAMGPEFKIMREWTEAKTPFPSKMRRPDFRSSGPKRLMPQLQIKVPTIRRWGRKMAVVIDLAFWSSLAEIKEVPHVSNCDVAWFVVNYEAKDGGLKLVRHAVHFTTLENSVEGLTGGYPVEKDRFENELRMRLRKAN
ncbi:MAG TPA: NotI family restriction endonuclease [Opitutales bacterium]|nr:NotI family restriction endonuclease [Opitutales bacterium]